MSALPSALSRPRAIIFDWDNTLVDSWATIHDALNFLMAAMERPLWTIGETRERVRLVAARGVPGHVWRTLAGGAANLSRPLPRHPS